MEGFLTLKIEGLASVSNSISLIHQIGRKWIYSSLCTMLILTSLFMQP